jgi:hypothetical protein
VAGDHYELSKHIERFLAALSKLYAQDGKRPLQEIIVNAQTRVTEGWTSEFESVGHALYLVIPEQLFPVATKTRGEIQKKICHDLNELHNYRSEFIAEVFLEMDVAEDHDWRQESGLLVTPSRTVAPESESRIWSDGGFRLFLSHKSEVKEQAATLKDSLGLFGVSAFVAHQDIRATKPWQDEIESALLSMDAFAALMTEGFPDSEWTDQEVGFALARGVPVIAVRLGRDPYGFLGKFQALRADWDGAAEGIVNLLMKHERMFSAYVRALRRCPSFDSGNVLAHALPAIEKATDQQIDELIAAVNANEQVRYSFGFRGNKRTLYGDGLIPHLHRLGSRRFSRGDNEAIMPADQVRRRATADDEIPF